MSKPTVTALLCVSLGLVFLLIHYFLSSLIFCVLSSAQATDQRNAKQPVPYLQRSLQRASIQLTTNDSKRKCTQTITRNRELVALVFLGL